MNNIEKTFRHTLSSNAFTNYYACIINALKEILNVKDVPESLKESKKILESLSKYQEHNAELALYIIYELLKLHFPTHRKLEIYEIWQKENNGYHDMQCKCDPCRKIAYLKYF